ncbi:hypothetical protein G5I_02996 [Acromyrmex echinatior]|uniref:Uncharacterized protein n=1 Tax=Acromyrmex echinatior TaxID=103372 RepID=F4WBS5_ACREC|nr:hypothetical protein G5I_02996 [Acromyrmex echinatior]
MRVIPSRQGTMRHMDKSAGCKIGARKGELNGKKEKRKSVYELQGDGPLSRREEESSTRTEERENRVGEVPKLELIGGGRIVGTNGERGGSPAAQAPLRRRHIDSSGKSLQNGRRRSIPSLLFVRAPEPRRDDDRMAGWLVGWLAGWMGERRRVTSAEGIELSTEAEGATSKDKLPA